MRLQPENLELYAITDRACIGQKNFYQAVEQALTGGVTCLQLREKNLPEEIILETAIALKKLCQSYHVPLIVNDNYQIALKSGADGVHVGRTDTPVKEIRNYAGNDFIIGATAKTVQQALEAEADGADYLGVGALFPSSTKPDAARMTPELVKQIKKAVKIPIVGIGGITEQNIHELAEYEFNGIAVVSAVFGAEDIQESAGNLRTIVKGWNHEYKNL